MKRKIKSAQSILWVLLLILSASCSKDEIQIVDQDTSWQMDNKYIEEDIREQLGIDPFTDLVYLGRHAGQRHYPILRSHHGQTGNLRERQESR